MSGRRIPVVVVAHQSSETGYSFVIPGYVSTNSNAYANCYGSTRGSFDATAYGNNISGTYRGTTDTSCTGSSTSATTVSPAQQVSYSVSGATLSLRLPDGRIAVVNCDSKVNWWGLVTKIARRSCRVPSTDAFEAEFKGEKAKLVWKVGVSGEADKSETYRLIEIVEPYRRQR